MRSSCVAPWKYWSHRPRLVEQQLGVDDWNDRALIELPDVILRAVLVSGAAGDPDTAVVDAHAGGMTRQPGSVGNLLPVDAVSGVPHVREISIPVGGMAADDPYATVVHGDVVVDTRLPWRLGGDSRPVEAV